jgi:FKBP-type peptidyl-prolyl cis-trans isomerase SlpA
VGKKPDGRRSDHVFYNGGSLQTLVGRSGRAESFMSSVQSDVRPVVQPGAFLTLHYRMAGPSGPDLINTFGGKPATLSLGTGQLSPAIEERMMGLQEGTHTTFELAAGTAFGPRNPDLVQWVARKLLDELGDPQEQYKAGDVVQFPTPDGTGQYAGAVQQVGGPAEGVQFDFNHPLAGQPVVFEVQMIGVL